MAAAASAGPDVEIEADVEIEDSPLHQLEIEAVVAVMEQLLKASDSLGTDPKPTAIRPPPAVPPPPAKQLDSLTVPPPPALPLFQSGTDPKPTARKRASTAKSHRHSHKQRRTASVREPSFEKPTRLRHLSWKVHMK